MKHLFHWRYLKLRRVKIETCLAGACWCRGAEECYFKRCANCDACVDDKGKTLEDRKVWHDLDWCPDCGAGFGELLGPLA